MRCYFEFLGRSSFFFFSLFYKYGWNLKEDLGLGFALLKIRYRLFFVDFLIAFSWSVFLISLTDGFRCGLGSCVAWNGGGVSDLLGNCGKEIGGNFGFLALVLLCSFFHFWNFGPHFWFAIRRSFFWGKSFFFFRFVLFFVFVFNEIKTCYLLEISLCPVSLCMLFFFSVFFGGGGVDFPNEWVLSFNPVDGQILVPFVLGMLA